jgi:phosphate transport system substrate-binding protein
LEPLSPTSADILEATEKHLVKTSRILALAAVATLAAGAASARDQIRIVGSSTVFPFSTAVAEQFGKTTDFRTPVVESTGSGGGVKLFCAGVGEEHPDITNSSRRMKAKEHKMCLENGVTDFTEVVVGFDGIVVANAKTAPLFALTRAQIWTALAETGPKPTMWSEIDPSLPAIKIEVLGPPPSSGTRDAFEELVMVEGCKDAAGPDCKKTAPMWKAARTTT